MKDEDFAVRAVAAHLDATLLLVAGHNLAPCTINLLVIAVLVNIEVSARIESLKGISGHADLGILLDWLGNLKDKPEQVFVNHGEDSVCDEFAETIKNTLGFLATAPYNGAVYDLITGECLEEGNKVRIRKEEPIFKGKKVSAIFENLLRAAKRLMAVVEKSSGFANKDIKKFTAEIDALCDKWEN